MFDRPHRVHEIDRLAAQRQPPEVRERKCRVIGGKQRTGAGDGRARDVDPYGPGALLGGPSQDLRSLGFVPEIRFEDGAAGEAWKELLEEKALAVEVVVRRGRPLEAREVAPDLGPEGAVGAWLRGLLRSPHHATRNGSGSAPRPLAPDNYAPFRR
jgi:hypothetical protein